MSLLHAYILIPDCFVLSMCVQTEIKLEFPLNEMWTHNKLQITIWKL